MSSHRAHGFLETSFWAVGAFCVYWESLVLAAIHRFREVELPLIGECSQVEAVILTLSFLWAPLLLLHLILHASQRINAESGARPRFPGAVGDEKVPTELKFVRVCLFAVLFLWPTGIHVFLTGRALDHFHIIPSDMAEKPTQEWTSLARSKLLFFPFARPAGSAAGDTFWWVNGKRAELREAWPEEIDLQNWLGQEKAPEKILRRVKLTAVWFHPFAFALFAMLAILSSFVACVNGFSRRLIPIFPWLPKRPPAFPPAKET